MGERGGKETAINRRGTSSKPGRLRLPTSETQQEGKARKRLGISCSCAVLAGPGCRKGRSNCARGSGQSRRQVDAFHRSIARHEWNGARNNLAPATELASCLLTDARERRLSFAARAQANPSCFFASRVNGRRSAAGAGPRPQKTSAAQRTATLVRERQSVANDRRRSKGFCCTAYRVALLIH